MAENATIYQRLQFGEQVSLGTPVAATQRMGAIVGSFNPQAEVATYKPAGYKFTTVASQLKEWSTITIEESPVTYDEIVYLLDSLIATATPTGNGTSTPYVWEYSPSVDGSQARTIYTVEHGSTDRGRDIADAVVSGLVLNFSRSGVTLTGAMTGKAMLDNQALTASLPVSPLIPVQPTQVGLKLAATQAGLAGASLQTRNFGITLDLSGFSGLVWPLNQSVDFAAHVDTMPSGTGTFILAVDTAGMAPLANLRAGSTLFARISAVGPNITGVTPTATHALDIDMAMKITSNPTMSDHEGTYVITWNYEIAYDPTWDEAINITVTNGVASL